MVVEVNPVQYWKALTPIDMTLYVTSINITVDGIAILPVYFSSDDVTSTLLTVIVLYLMPLTVK